MINYYIGLVHHPIKNKNNLEITTSVTNLDIHDIARSSRTFGSRGYFIITPVKAQKELLSTILGHWKEDSASVYNPDRSDALSHVYHQESLDLAMDEIEKLEGQRPKLVVTGANFAENDGGMKELIGQAQIDKVPLFIVFGTGWGLTDSIIARSDFRLAPIIGAAQDGYNHLSVRSAVAIYLNQLSWSL